MKTIEEINQHNVNKILSEKKIPEFYPGDVVKVGVRIRLKSIKKGQIGDSRPCFQSIGHLIFIIYQ